MPLAIISKDEYLRYMRDAQGIDKSSGEKKKNVLRSISGFNSEVLISYKM